MNQQFREAVRVLLSQVKTVDEQGFVSFIHVSFFDNLRIEYEAHCRKHGIQVRARAKRKELTSTGS